MITLQMVNLGARGGGECARVQENTIKNESLTIHSQYLFAKYGRH